VRRLRGHSDRDGQARNGGPKRHPRRRDRHGRGLRGSLAPRDVPLSRTRSESFDDLVLDAVEEIEAAVHDDASLVTRLAAVELGVEDVPPPAALQDAAAGRELPLGRVEAGTRDRAARLIVYRRPLELRAGDVQDRGRLVHEVVVEHLAELLEVPVDRLDPD
jgi:hypothetical protein